MILPGFPVFFAQASAGISNNLTAAAYAYIGYNSSALRTIFGDPGPDIGVLSPVPDASKTWLALGSDGLGGSSIGFALSGNQTGYMTGKTFRVGADAYTTASAGFAESYDAGFNITQFAWDDVTIIVDGNTYTVTIT